MMHDYIHKKNSLITTSPMFVLSLITFSVLQYCIIQNNSYSNSTINVLVASLIWIGVAFIRSSETFVSIVQKKCIVALVIFSCYVFLLSFYYSNAQSALSVTLVRITLFTGIIIFIYYCKTIDYKKRVIIFWITIAFWTWAAIELMILYAMYPGIAIAREIASSMADVTVIESVGSPYAIAQGLCFITITLFYVVYSGKVSIKKRYKITIYIIIALFTVCIIQTQSTITILTEIVCLSSIFLFSRAKTGLKRMVIFIIVFSVLLLTNDYIGRLLVLNFNSSTNWVSIRLNEIGKLLSENTMSNDFNYRLELAADSLNTFLKHPFLGNLFGLADNVSGNHCELLDIFADYGLLGGIPYIMIFITYFAYLKRKLKLFNMMVWFPILITSILNPFVLNQSYFSALFVVPFIYLVAENGISINDNDYRKDTNVR